MAPASNETVVAAIVDADQMSDAEIAKRYGVASKTISDWRARALNDPELRKLVDAARRKVHASWRSEAARTYIALAKRVRTLADDGEEIPFSLIAAAKAFGSANLVGDALLDEDNDDEEPEKP